MADAILAQSGIYTITNLINGKQYVGSSCELERRKSNHFWHLGRGSHRNIKLQRAWKKYPEGTLVFEVIEVVENESDLLQREQFWIDHLCVLGAHGYNIAAVAGRTTGYVHTEEARRKMSEFQSGRIGSPCSDATKAKIAESNRNPSQERRLAIVQSLTGQVFSDARREKISAARKLQVMRPLSDETKAKISAAHLGRKHSAEIRANMSAAQKGKKVDPAIIEALAAHNRGVPRSAEVRAKISAGHLARRLKKSANGPQPEGDE